MRSPGPLVVASARPPLGERVEGLGIVMRLHHEGSSLVRVEWGGGGAPREGEAPRWVDGETRGRASKSPAARWLQAYLRGTFVRPALPLRPAGTPFAQQVWALVSTIPAGETRSYGELAEALGRPGAARAVGRANASNPLPIFIPCHRVVAANGEMCGYAGGLALKERLLAHEGVHLPSARQLELPAQAY